MTDITGIVDDIAFVSNDECRFTLVNPLGPLLQILRPSTVLESTFQLLGSHSNPRNLEEYSISVARHYILRKRKAKAKGKDQ